MPHLSQTLRTVALAAGLAIASAGVFAQALELNYDELRPVAEGGGRSGGRVGAALIAGHQYMGSDESRTSLLPIIDYQWSSGWFAGISNGVGYDFSSQPGLRYGLRLTADAGRKENRSSALAGLGDISARPEIGAFLSAGVGSGLMLTSSLRYGSGNDRKGFLASLGADYGLALAPSWRLKLGVGATLANADYMQEHFGISAAQSATSGYAPYSACGGVRDVHASAGITYSIQKGMNVSAQLSETSLQGDAADSPITRQKTSPTALVAFSYAF